MPQNEVTEAVRSLREQLGDTQQQFATRMGWAISSVVRYERSRPPRGKVLGQLEKVATDNGCFKEATIFRDAFSKEFDIWSETSTESPAFSYLRLIPQNSREEELVQFLLWGTRYSANRAGLKDFEEQLRPYGLEKKKFEEALNGAAVEFCLVIDESLRSKSPEVIAETLPADLENVKLWLTLPEALRGDLVLFRSFLQELSLGRSANWLAAHFRIPISTVKAVQQFRSQLGIPIVKTIDDDVNPQKRGP